MAEKQNKSRTSMFALVQAGKEEAEKVQNIKSVAAQVGESTPVAGETTAPVAKENVEKNQEGNEITENPIEKDVLKGLSMLFTKREVTDTEAVKIPREFHRELKVLSSMSGTSMMQMIGNLIESFLNDNQKEIVSYKKKYLNGTIGKK